MIIKQKDTNKRRRHRAVSNYCIWKRRGREEDGNEDEEGEEEGDGRD